MTQEKAQHTPGPWTLMARLLSEEDEAECGSHHWPIVCAPPVNATLVEMPYDRPFLEQAANARLIAAAPDLLAALDYLLEQTVDMDLNYGIELTEGEVEARAQALAAIKKATNQNP